MASINNLGPVENFRFAGPQNNAGPAIEIPGLAEQFDNPPPPGLQGLDLDFNPTFTLENPDAGTAAGRFGFLDSELDFSPAEPESTRMSRGEIVDSVRNSVEGVLGEDGTKALIGLGGLAHIATGGEISVDTGRFSEIEFSTEGARWSWEMKF